MFGNHAVFALCAGNERSRVCPNVRNSHTQANAAADFRSFDRSLLVMVYTATTTAVIVPVSRLHVQMVSVPIDSRGMVIIVTAGPVSADAVRSVSVAGITSVSDGKRASGRKPGVAEAQSRTAVSNTVSAVPALRCCCVSCDGQNHGPCKYCNH